MTEPCDLPAVAARRMIGAKQLSPVELLESCLARTAKVNHAVNAMVALDADRAFLTAGGVFDDDMIDAYIELKQEEIDRLRMTTHPVEFDMYYSCCSAPGRTDPRPSRGPGLFSPAGSHAPYRAINRQAPQRQEAP